MIYVDPPRVWPQLAKPGQSRRHFGNGKKSSHMWTDGPLEELVAFAVEHLDLKVEWLQEDHPELIHFDLTLGKFHRARRAGAMVVSLRTWLREHRAELVPEEAWDGYLEA
jgi:uncharacterized protein DUF4031